MKIVFMGTPDFAVPALKKLLTTRNEIVGVYTKKPKKCDRGQKVHCSPIYELASKNNLEIFTPTTFKNEKNVAILKSLQPDLIVVVAYGLILTKDVIEIPKYGCLNIHPSLLPRWRGSAPLQRCLLSDDTESGVCIMYVDEGVDSGDVVSVYKRKIDKSTTLEELHDEFSTVGANMLCEAIEQLNKNGSLPRQKQEDDKATLAPKIEKSEGLLKAQDDIKLVDKKIRTLGAFPGCFFRLQQKRIKILKAEIIETSNDFKDSPLGTIVDDNFTIKFAGGLLKPLILQPEGKKAMTLKEFLNGHPVKIGERINS